jgi:hypothetical protein
MVNYAKFCDFDLYICNALFSRVCRAVLTSICVYPELSVMSMSRFKTERGHYDDLPTLRVLDLVIVDILS